MKIVFLLMFCFLLPSNFYSQNIEYIDSIISGQNTFFKEKQSVLADTFKFKNFYTLNYKKIKNKYFSDLSNAPSYIFNELLSKVRNADNDSYKKMLDSLLKIPEYSKNNLIKSQIEYNYARYYYNANNIDSCSFFLEQSFSSTKTLKNEQFFQNILFQNLLLRKKGFGNKAYKVLLKHKEILKKYSNNKQLIFDYLIAESKTLSFVDSTKLAITKTYNILKLYDSLTINNPVIKLECYHNLAIFYNEINDYNTSYYYNYIFKLDAILLNYPYKYRYFDLMSKYCFSIGELDNALNYTDKYLLISKDIANKNLALTALGNKAIILLYLGEIQKSKDVLLEVIKNEEREGFKLHYSQSLASLSRIYYFLEQDKKADSCFIKAKKNIDNEPYKHSYYANWYEEKYNDYELNLNYKKALEYYKFMDFENKMLFKKSYYDQMAKSEKKYQTQQKETQILRLSNKNLKNEAKIIKSKYLIYTIFSLLLLTLGTVFFFWNRRKQKQKMELLETSIQATEQEKKRIGKELHDGIASSIIRLVHEVEGNDVILSDKLLKTYNEVRDLSHQLNNTPIHGEVFLDRLIELIPVNKDNQIFILKTIPNNLYIQEPFGTHIYRIIQELITNNLKHAKATKTIIKVEYHNKRIDILYQDNGIGIKALIKKSGLKNIEDRVSLMNGETAFNFDEGFHVAIKIPYDKKKMPSVY